MREDIYYMHRQGYNISSTFRGALFGTPEVVCITVSITRALYRM